MKMTINGGPAFHQQVYNFYHWLSLLENYLSDTWTVWEVSERKKVLNLACLALTHSSTSRMNLTFDNCIKQLRYTQNKIDLIKFVQTIMKPNSKRNHFIPIKCMGLSQIIEA